MKQPVTVMLFSLCVVACSSDKGSEPSDSLDDQPEARSEQAQSAHGMNDLERIARGVLDWHAEGRLIECRATWPRDEPVHFAVQRDISRLGETVGAQSSFATVDFLDCHGEMLGTRATVDTLWLTGSDDEYIDGPVRETFAIPPGCFNDPDDSPLHFRVRAGDETSATYPLDLPITFVDSVHDVLETHPDPAVTAFVQQALEETVLIGSRGTRENACCQLLLKLADRVPADMAVAFNVLVVADGKAVATGPVLCGEGCRAVAHPDGMSYIPLTLQWIDEAQVLESEDDAIVLSFIADPLLALRDFAAERAWQGSLSTRKVSEGQGKWVSEN